MRVSGPTVKQRSRGVPNATRRTVHSIVIILCTVIGATFITKQHALETLRIRARRRPFLAVLNLPHVR